MVSLEQACQYLGPLPELCLLSCFGGCFAPGISLSRILLQPWPILLHRLSFILRHHNLRTKRCGLHHAHAKRMNKR